MSTCFHNTWIMYVLQGKNYLSFSLLAGTLNAHPSHYNEITNVFLAIRINKYIILHDNVVLSVVITVVQSSTKRRFKWPLPLPQIPLPPLPVLPWQHTTTRCVAGSELYETDVWPRGGAGVRLHGASGSQTYLAHCGLCEWFPYSDHLIYSKTCLQVPHIQKCSECFCKLVWRISNLLSLLFSFSLFLSLSIINMYLYQFPYNSFFLTSTCINY